MKKKICLLIILLLALTVIPVKATDLIASNDETLIAPNENELIVAPEQEESNFIADNVVDTNKLIDGTAFVAGNHVTVASPIDGALFVAGNVINLSSTQDILFAAGNNLSLHDIKTKDAFVAGTIINVDSSEIRDLYAAANTININSNIYRNAYLGGNSVTLTSRIEGDAYIEAENIVITKDAQILGTLKYPENASITIAKGANVKAKKTYKTTEVKTNYLSVIGNQLFDYLSMLLIGIILLALNKKVFNKIDKIKLETNTLAKEFGMGFACLLAAPIAAIICMMTGIGVPLGIIVLMIYGIMAYLSFIPTAYYLGHVLLRKKIKNKFFYFALALLGIYIIRLIPILGGLVTFVAICFGLGVYTDLLLKQVKQK